MNKSATNLRCTKLSNSNVASFLFANRIMWPDLFLNVNSAIYIFHELKITLLQIDMNDDEDDDDDDDDDGNHKENEIKRQRTKLLYINLLNVVLQIECGHMKPNQDRPK